MAVLEIVTVPNKILKRNAKPVTSFGADLQQLIDDMVDTMREAPGVGLAGPQVGVLQQVIVVEFGDEEDEEAPKKLYTLVNPKIARASEETIMGIEGCLSIPELVGDVERSVSVTVKAQNRHGQPMKVRASGWLARIFQHEIDHLNGILFTDRTDAIYRLEDLLEEQEEAEAETGSEAGLPPVMG